MKTRKSTRLDLDSLTEVVKQRKSPTRTPTKKSDLLLASYADDPVAFARDILGVDVTTFQEQQLKAICEHDRVAVAAGHRTGRTMAFACALLWWCSTRHGARALLSTPSHAHMRATIWRQLRDLVHGTKQPLACEWHQMPSGGVQFKSGNEIVGIASDAGERLQGYAAQHLLIVVDECAGYPEGLFPSLMSNLAGGGKALIGGNPTRRTGPFADAFKKSAQAWHTMHISALDVAQSGLNVPGLATLAWCEGMKQEWGEDGVVYPPRVLGQFAKQDANTVIPFDVIEEAITRWRAAPRKGQAFQNLGPLEIGCDPARFGVDETVIVCRRGHVALEPSVFRKLDGAEVAAKVLALANDLRKPDERPTVRVDSIGIGASVVDHLKRHTSIRLIPINVAETAHDAASYARRRDEVWFVLKQWLVDGGAIPNDPKLEADLASVTYSFNASQKIAVEGKDSMKARLHRSPDRADALALSVYACGAKNARFTATSLTRAPFAQRIDTRPRDNFGRIAA
jgi:hypothetical protein